MLNSPNVSSANVQSVLLSVGEAARFLGIGRSTVYGLLSDGDLTGVKIGSRTLIRRSDAEALVERLPVASVSLAPRKEAPLHAPRDRTRRPAARRRPPAVDRPSTAHR